jgi:hypothetical protein
MIYFNTFHLIHSKYFIKIKNFVKREHKNTAISTNYFNTNKNIQIYTKDIFIQYIFSMFKLVLYCKYFESFSDRKVLFVQKVQCSLPLR